MSGDYPLFTKLCKWGGIPQPEAEYMFAKEALGRKWMIDFAWPQHKLGLECDGGIWKKGGGRHTRGSGWLKDTEKLNAAACLGWRMLRCTPQQLCTTDTIDLIKRALAA